MNPEILLPLAFALAAALYASVGHGGASAYLAVMALVGMAPGEMRLTALSMNAGVSAVAAVLFFRHFRWGLFWPFALMAVPCAWWGGMTEVHPRVFYALVGIALLAGAGRLFLHSAGRPPLAPKVSVALLLGGMIGFVSGLVGVGGGIFLTPLLILTGWARAKEAAAVSALFILINSLAGLGGIWKSGTASALPEGILFWLAAALIGGTAGAHWGSVRAHPVWLRPVLGVVLVVAALKFGGQAFA